MLVKNQIRTDQRADAQEVSMTEIMEKVFGTKDKRKLKKDLRDLQRNANNTARILNEFPWLWAVRPDWTFAQTIMRVSNEDLSPFFSRKIEDEIGMGEDRIHGVFIHTSSKFNGMPTESVEAVWNGNVSTSSICNFPGEKWHQAIHSRIHRNDTEILLHIVLVYWEGVAMVIYRPKPATSFNFAIDSFAVGEM
jgi:hypothetical protein